MIFPPLVLEIGTGALMLVVFGVGLFGPTHDRRLVGVVATTGVLALGVLAMYYGDRALELMRTHGQVIAMWIAGLIVLAAVLWWLRGKRLARSRAADTP